MKKSLKILFTLSVLLNVVLLGTVAGMVVKHRDGDMPWHEARKELTPGGQAMMMDTMQKTWADMKPLMDEAKTARENLKTEMMKDDFDAKKYDEIMKEMETVQKRMADAKMKSIRTFIVHLSPDERKKMAPHIIRAFEWRRRKMFGPMPNQNSEADDKK